MAGRARVGAGKRTTGVKRKAPMVRSAAVGSSGRSRQARNKSAPQKRPRRADAPRKAWGDIGVDTVAAGTPLDHDRGQPLPSVSGGASNGAPTGAAAGGGGAHHMSKLPPELLCSPLAGGVETASSNNVSATEPDASGGEHGVAVALTSTPDRARWVAARHDLLASAERVCLLGHQVFLDSNAPVTTGLKEAIEKAKAVAVAPVATHDPVVDAAEIFVRSWDEVQSAQYHFDDGVLGTKGCTVEEVKEGLEDFAIDCLRDLEKVVKMTNIEFGGNARSSGGAVVARHGVNPCAAGGGSSSGDEELVETFSEVQQWRHDFCGKKR